MTADHVALHDHSGNFAKAWEDRLTDNISVILPSPFPFTFLFCG